MKHTTFHFLLLLIFTITSGCSDSAGSDGGSHEDLGHESHDDHDDQSHGDRDNESHGGHGEDSHEAEPLGLELTPEQVSSAGIRTTNAAPGELKTTLTLSAVVSENLDAQAHVNPRVPGLVRSVQGRLGQTIKVGDPLCELDSVEFGRAVSDYLKANALLRSSEATLQRERELLDRAVDLAATVLEREKSLSEREITTKRLFFEADQSLRDAKLRRDRRTLELEGQIEANRVELKAAQTRLLILGVPPEGLSRMEGAQAGTEGRYVIRSPRDGIIVARHITEGESVATETKLFKIQDLATVWVLASVYEHDLSSIKLGARARVVLDAFPNSSFEGKVDFIDFHVDPTTRAASVRILVENKAIPEWEEPFPIRPGLYGRVQVLSASKMAPIIIPEKALVHEGEHDFVFVQIEDGHFEERSVQVSPETNGVVEVFDGLSAGELVVVEGTFGLKSLSRKGELGGGHSH